MDAGHVVGIALVLAGLAAVTMGEMSVTRKAMTAWMIVYIVLIAGWVITLTLIGDGLYALGALIVAALVSGLYTAATGIRHKREKRRNK